MGKKRLTIEMLRERVSDDFTILSEEVISSKDKIRIRHNKCGYEWDILPTGLKGLKTCPKCRNNSIASISSSRRKSFEQFKKEVETIHNGEYELLSTEYVNNATKVKIRHKVCGHEFEMVPSNFVVKNGAKCPKCQREEATRKCRETTEEFKQEVFDLVGDEFTVLGEYTYNQGKIKMRHEKCGYEFEMRPIDFKRGQRCPKCAHRTGCTLEEIKQIVFDEAEDEYTVLNTEFSKFGDDLILRHEVCKRTFITKKWSFVGLHSRCPYCRESKSEKRIEKFLKKKGIEFEREKKFEDLVYKHPLKIDFYIPSLNKAIEYDGIQHFKPVFGEESLKKQKERDKAKTDYCSSHNIDLLRIPYDSEKDILDQVKEFLNL